ncbi:MAG: tetratricopeptide repeat protein [Comamonas sp.]
MQTLISRFESMLAGGRDSALLRYTLGKAYVDEGNPQAGLEHLRKAVEMDAHYSVAWKYLGKAWLELGDAAQAREAWLRGKACAEERGDAQVVKELAVFLKRLDKPARS